MKTVKLLLIGIALNSCGLKHNEGVEKQNVEKILPKNEVRVNQNKASEKEVENMLNTFYSNHFKIWETSNMSFKIKSQKLDSLKQIYCTSELINEANEASLNSGADILTYDLNGDTNENLKVEKDPEKKNRYIVSYMSTFSDIPDGPVKDKVILHVTVTKEGDKFKIMSVVGTCKAMGR